jgi:hypothetical protein
MITGFLNDKKIDFNQLDNITLAKAFIDFSDPSQRGSEIVFDFTLPPTKNNHEVFRDANNPHSDLFFQKEYNMQIFAQGLPVARGKFVLKSVTDEGYTGYISNPENDWLDFFQETKLADIDWSDELCQSQPYIEGANRNGLDDKFCFPLIDYGNISEAVYTSSDIYTTDFFPAVFIYPLLRDLFKKAGWKLNPEWFLQETNYNLMLPFTNDDIALKDPTISQEDVDYIEAEIAPSTISLPVATTITLPLTSVLSDKDNMLFLPSEFNFEAENEWNGLTCSNVRGFDTEVSFSGDFAVNIGVGAIVVETLRNGTPVDLQVFNLTTTPSTVNYSYILPNFVGTEQALIRITAVSATVTNTSTVQVFATRLKVTDREYEFLRFYLKNQLPDMSPYELLRDIIQMYNLYIIADNNAKIITLKPLQEALKQNGHQYDDWTGKCSDKNNELAIIKDEMPSKMIYAYTSGSDYLNAIHEQATGYPYGTQIIKTGAKNNNTSQTEMVTAPTINRRVSQYYIACYWQGDYTNPTSATDFEFQTGTEPRICKYVQAEAVSPVIVRSDTTGGTYNLLPTPLYGTAVFEVNHERLKPLPATYLPEFAGHNLQFCDMLTGTLKEGLYARWYLSEQNRMLSGKKATLRVLITPRDYQNPNLFTKRKLITLTLRNERYSVMAYLNDIKDYIPNLNQMTTCEFIII